MYILCKNRGGSRIFFRRGCTRLLLYFNTNKSHSFFFCRIPVVLENRRSSRGGGGGVRTPCTLPLDPPLKRNISLTGIIPFNIHKNLTFSYKIKTNYSPSAYLDLTRKNPSRKTLVKLRISSHKLRIETGRYDNIPRDDGLCSFSNCNRIEDETQILLDCPSFSSIREMFFSRLKP